MAVEIEAKLKVDDLAPVQARLEGLEATFVAHQDQQDLYFDNAQRQMVTQDKCLRVRIQATDQGTQTFVTFKGPKQQADVKCREEIEIPASDPDQATALLEGLGYEQKMIVHKHRELWSYKQCLIGLDRITDLGSYVEIEGPSSDMIKEVQQNLELENLTHCQKSYACLLAEYQKLKTKN
ncbi:MAG: class IV adenylate cyclase [Phycisphaerae bacterium]|nr:class IV adenylate cyclase [Phycisphaerae bacterium]